MSEDVPSVVLRPAAPPVSGSNVPNITELSRSVHDSMDEALKVIPPGQDGAYLLKGTFDEVGNREIQAIVATRIGKNWSAYSTTSWAGGDHLSETVGVVGSWKW